MGKELYEQYSVCKNVFDSADEALGFSIRDICFSEDERIHLTEFAQPAIVTLSIAALALFEQEGVTPIVNAGLSLGEYSALVSSGAMAFTDAVKLVRKRGELMANAVPSGFGAMSAVLSLANEKVEEACRLASDEDKTGEYQVYAANYNLTGQVIISGSDKAVARAEEICKEMGAKRVMRIKTSGPFHTPYLKKAAAELGDILAQVSIGEMKTPVVTNVTAEVIASKADIIPTLVKQMTSPVLWEASVKRMIDMGAERFIEFGPGKTLAGFVKKINKDVDVYHIEDIKSYEAVLEKVR